MVSKLSEYKEIDEVDIFILKDYLKSIQIDELKKRIKIFEENNFEEKSKEQIIRSFLHVVNFEKKIPFIINKQKLMIHEYFFVRSRKIDQNYPWSDINNYWESPLISQNRFNLKEKALYAALDCVTIRKESNLNDDEKFSITFYKLKKDLNFYVAEIFPNDFEKKGFDLKENEKLTVIINFINDTLSRQKKDGHVVAYNISKFLTKKMKIDGILYNSTKQKGGINACFFNCKNNLNIIATASCICSEEKNLHFEYRVPFEKEMKKIDNDELQIVLDELKTFKNLKSNKT